MAWNENLVLFGAWNFFVWLLLMHLSARAYGTAERKMQTLTSPLIVGGALGSAVARVEASHSGPSSGQPAAREGAKGTLTSGGGGRGARGNTRVAAV